MEKCNNEIVLTDEQIEQAVTCCSKEDCSKCPLSEMAKKPPLICFDILFPNLLGYIKRINDALSIAVNENRQTLKTISDFVDQLIIDKAGETSDGVE